MKWLFCNEPVNIFASFPGRPRNEIFVANVSTTVLWSYCCEHCSPFTIQNCMIVIFLPVHDQDVSVLHHRFIDECLRRLDDLMDASGGALRISTGKGANA